MPAKTASPTRKEKNRVAVAAKRADETAADFDVVATNLRTFTAPRQALERIKRRFARVWGEVKRLGTLLATTKDMPAMLADANNARVALARQLEAERDQSAKLEDELAELRENNKREPVAPAVPEAKPGADRLDLSGDPYTRIRHLTKLLTGNQEALRQAHRGHETQLATLKQTEEGLLARIKEVEAGQQEKLDLQWQAAKAVESERDAAQAKVEELTTALGVAEQRLTEMRVQHTGEAQAFGAASAALNADADAKVFKPAPLPLQSDNSPWPLAEAINALASCNDDEEAYVGIAARRSAEIWLRTIDPLQTTNARLRMDLLREKRTSTETCGALMTARDEAIARADTIASHAAKAEGMDAILKIYMDDRGEAFRARDAARRDLEAMTARLREAITAGMSLADQLKEAKLAEQKARHARDIACEEGQAARDKLPGLEKALDAARQEATATLAALQKAQEAYQTSLFETQSAREGLARTQKERDEKLCVFVLARAANFAKVHPSDLRLWIKRFHDEVEAPDRQAEANLAPSNESTSQRLTSIFTRNFRLAFRAGTERLYPSPVEGSSGAPASGSPA